MKTSRFSRMMRLAPLLVAAVITLPAKADGNIVVEAINTSAPGFSFGKYNGLYDDKARLNGGINWSEDGTDYIWQIEARNLGLRNRDIKFQLRTVSDFSFSASYSESTNRGNDSGTTPFAGSSVQRLPSGWLPAVTTGDFDTGQIVRGFDNDVLRKTLSVSAGKRFSPAFKLKGDLEFVERSGTRPTGAAIYTNAANPQAVLLPEPIDQGTLRAGVTTEIDTGKLALVAKTYLVQFRNDENGMTWQNPYASGLGANVDYPAGVGGLASEPDYDQYGISLSGSYRLIRGVRLVISGAESRTEQDQELAPFTVNPLLTVAGNRPMTSLDGRLETRRLNFFLLARPFTRASLNFKYRYRARENTASRFAWNSVIGDGVDQPDPRLSLFNRPLEKEVDRYLLEGGYRLPGGQRLEAAYEYEESYRNYAAVTDAELETWRFKISSDRRGSMHHSVEALIENHGGSTYEWSRSFFQTFAVDLINQIPDDQRWTNHPLLRQYHLANHENVSLNWRTFWQPSDRWQIELVASARDVEFDKSELGLTDTFNHRVSLNVNYSGGDQYHAWAWLSWDRDNREQLGRDFGGGIQKPANRVVEPLPEGSNPDRNYGIEQDNRVVSLGLGMEWRLSERVQIRSEYTGIVANEEHRVGAPGVRDLVGDDLPSIRYRMHNLSTSVEWQVRDNLTVTAQHIYYRYEDDDYAWQGLGTGDIAKVLTGGQQPPNEVINLFSVAVRYALER